MQKLISKVWGPIALLCDTLLVIDLATDLYRKYKIKKWRKNHQSSETNKEDDATAAATA